MASKKELVEELKAKMEEFGAEAIWAAEKSSTHEKLAVGKSGSARTRHLKAAAKFEGESDAWNQAAWQIKGILAGFGK